MKPKRALRGVWRLTVLLVVILLAGLVVNLGLLTYAVFSIADTNSNTKVPLYAEALKKTGGVYTLPAQMEKDLATTGAWAMLIANETGAVVWSYEKPGDVPEQYTLSEIASFSRWYLQDYPVKVWAAEDGLFVLGAPKDSAWKYPLEMPISQLEFWPVWLLVAAACNFSVILGVALWMKGRWQKERDAARSQWIAAVSHDIRTPLSMVLGYAANLEDDGALPEKQRQQASLIRCKGEEMRLLIADLNLANRLEYTMEPLQIENLSPAALVRQAAAMFINGDLEGKYPLEVEIAPAVERMMLWGDQALLSRALQNLIGNSRRHNPQGCDIRMELTRERRRLKLMIRDNGVGFAPKQLALLQAKARSAADSRHGLGLHIVKHIVHVHGGRIRFKNEPQGGCSCTIWLKVHRDKRGKTPRQE